jgi:N-acetyl-anhydromuramyl-L-alanine amidase AmpD
MLTGGAGLVPRALAQPADDSPLAAAFERAAREFDVPRDLLVAIAYAETHFDDHGGAPSVANGYGLMHLVDNPQARSLGQAAAALRVDAAALKADRVQNIRGGAAVLRAVADAAGLTGATRRDLGAWYPAVARYGNATSPDAARLYADEIYRLLAQGLSGQSPEGETLSVAPQDVSPQLGAYATATTALSPDYPGALWVPASPSNYTAANRPSDYPIDRIVIHTTEGSYASAISWFQNPAARASAHYVVRSSDGHITQMVRERDVAWHAGNWAYNTRSIGLEHEAFIRNASWYTDVMYRTSAMLTRSLCRKYGIPMDRQHIIGHNEVPDPYHPGQYGGANRHQDPGPYWDWAYYMQLVTTTPAAPVGPKAGATYFPQTGHNLGAAFRDYWNAYGGLAQFGYPRTEEFPEQSRDDGKVYTVQYFERARFEYHPENAGSPYVVLLGLLGRDFHAPDPPAAPLPGQSYFPQTGHNLGGVFRDYWNTHGGLFVSGYPISEAFTEVNPSDGRTYTVQYFERARYEYHPEYAGTPYVVLLGLLGDWVLQQRGWLP